MATYNVVTIICDDDKLELIVRRDNSDTTLVLEIIHIVENNNEDKQCIPYNLFKSMIETFENLEKKSDIKVIVFLQQKDSMYKDYLERIKYTHWESSNEEVIGLVMLSKVF